MLYSPFCPLPKFTHYLIEKQYLNTNNPLSVVDVGASGGPEYHWANYGDAIQFVGFEPNEEECKKLNISQQYGTQYRFYPIALFKDKGTYTFYHQATAASGFYPGDQRVVSRMPDEHSFDIKKTSLITTVDFDSFTEEYGIPNTDFMKLDAEGAELDIFAGAIKTLKTSLLGISCEVLFLPWRGENRTYAEIEQSLRPYRFKLYDLNLYRYTNKAFPAVGSVGPSRSGEAPYGRVGLGQAIFFRDAVDELLHDPSTVPWWTENRVLKLASLFEVFHLPDCAIELLNVAGERNILSHSLMEQLSRFRDLITSGFIGRSITYEQYQMRLQRIQRRGYINHYERIKPYLKKIPYISKLRATIKKRIARRRDNTIS